MVKWSSVGMDKLPEKWQASQKQIKANQLAFNLSSEVVDFYRALSAARGVQPSDLIREIVGLATKPPQRPRLTFSASREDLEQLAERYRLEHVDPEAIRTRVRDELLGYYARHHDDDTA